jgi:hypothetical protein
MSASKRGPRGGQLEGGSRQYSDWERRALIEADEEKGQGGGQVGDWQDHCSEHKTSLKDIPGEIMDQIFCARSELEVGLKMLGES